MNNMEIQPPNSSSDGSTSDDFRENSMTAFTESSHGDTGDTVEMILKQEPNTLIQDKIRFPVFKEKTGDDEMSLIDNTCVDLPELTESLHLDGFDLPESENVSLNQNLFPPFDEKTSDNYISLIDNNCVPEFTESSKFNESDLSENENVALDQNLFRPFEEKTCDNDISLIDNNCVPELTESSQFNESDLYENENVALDQNLFRPFEEKTSDNETLFTDNMPTCAPEFTDILNLDLADSETLELGQIIFLPFGEKTDDVQISLTDNTCVPELTDSLSLNGLDLTKSENVALGQNLFYQFDEKTRDNEILHTHNTCVPELTESLNADGSDLIENENEALDQNLFHPFDEKTSENEISLTDNTFAHLFTDSLNFDGFDLTESENEEQDKYMFHSIEETPDDNEITFFNNMPTYTPELTELLKSGGFYLFENENVALDQHLSSQFEGNMRDNEISHADNTCTPQLTDSLQFNEFDLTENENVALDQHLSSQFEGNMRDNEISHADNTCTPQLTDSLQFNEFDLTENENVALDQHLSSKFEGTISYNEISHAANTCTPQLTDSLQFNEFDLTEKENVELDHDLFPPLEENLDNNEISLSTNVCVLELTDSLNSSGFDVTENEKAALTFETKDCSTNETLLNDSVNLDLPDDDTQLDILYLPKENVLSSVDLSPINVQMVSSDVSSNSDSDAVTSQVLSPCPILPQEMSIMSPTMAFSFTEENNFFKTFFPDNKVTDIRISTTEDQTCIGQTSDNSVLREGDGDFFLLSKHEIDSDNTSPRNTKSKEQCSEQFFIGQILQRIDTYQPEDMSTNIQDRSITDDSMDIKTSSTGENFQLNVGHFLNDDIGSDSRFVIEGPQTVKLSSLEFSSINSSNSLSQPIVAERDIRDNLENIKLKPEFTQNKSQFLDKNVTDYCDKADTQTIGFLCENYNDNYDNVNVIDLPIMHNSEQSAVSSEARMQIIQSPLLSESSAQTDRESPFHDEILNIIKEYRRLTTRDDFDIHDLEVRLREKSCNPCSDDISTRTKVTVPGLCNDPLVIQELNESNTLSNEATSIDLMHDTSHEVHGNDSPNGNPSVQLQDTLSGEIKNWATIFGSQKEFISKSEMFTRTSSTPPPAPVQEVSKEDNNLFRNEKSNTLRGIFLTNCKRNNAIVPDRGIFRTAKEKQEHFYPKRVSFCTDHSFRWPDQKSHYEMFPDNININEVGNERSDARRASFNVDQQFNYGGMEYARSHSFDIDKPGRFLDRFSRAKSFPVQTEFYFPRRDTCTDNSGDMLLECTAFDQIRSKEKINFLGKEKSLDDNCYQIDNNSLDGATNLAFHLESPITQSSLEDEDDDDNEEDSSDETKGVNKLFLPKDIETLQDFELFEKGKVRFSARKHSTTTELQEAATRRNKRLRLWYSLDEPVSEKTSLTNSSTDVKKLYSKHVSSSEDKLSFQEKNKDIDETTFSSFGARRHSNVKAKDEDNLSLEFFVPGKHKYIRLHRRTFIHFVLKYSIFFFSFLFWIASVSGIGFCAWMLTSNTVVIDDVSDLFLDPYVLLCVVSGTIFLVAFFGCVGALRENICLLQLFHISLTAVLVLEVLLSSLVFLFYTMPEFRKVAKVGPEEVLKKAVIEYLDNEVLRNWIDMVQKEFQCCGVSMSNHGYMDWQENPYYNCSTSNPSVYRCSVPLSCCIFMPGDYINYMCGAGVTKKEESEIIHIINTKGCMKSFGEWLGKNDAVIGYVALGVIVPQILGVIATRFFIKNLRARKTSWQQLSDPVQIVTPS